MKKILGFVVVLAVMSSSALVLANEPAAPTANPTASAPIAANTVDKNAETKAREMCTKKGLAGGWLDECIKGEVAKMNNTNTTTTTPATTGTSNTGNTNAAQNTNKPATSN